MIEILHSKDVYQRNDIHIFHYVLNPSGVRMMEFGAVFVLAIAALIYPVTLFEPQIWMAVPVILSPIGIFLLILAQYWRGFVKKAFIAFDDEYLFVGNDIRRVYAVPWHILDVHNTGLTAPDAGANLTFNIEGQKFPVRLFTSVVCIPQFETILRTILTHIRDNSAKNENTSEK